MQKSQVVAALAALGYVDGNNPGQLSLDHFTAFGDNGKPNLVLATLSMSDGSEECYLFAATFQGDSKSPGAGPVEGALDIIESVLPGGPPPQSLIEKVEQALGQEDEIIIPEDDDYPSERGERNMSYNVGELFGDRD